MNVAALIAGELSVPRSAGWDVLEVLEKSVSLSQGIHEHLLSKKLLEKLNIQQTNKQTEPHLNWESFSVKNSFKTKRIHLPETQQNRMH